MSAALTILLGAIAGSIAGSFAGALVTRWPLGRSVGAGRSRCDSCGRVLAPRELVPVLSFLYARGRCGTCGAAIPPDHLAAEIACALVGATAFAAAPPAVALAGALFGWTLVVLALLDLRHFWLPDRLTLPLAAIGVAAAAGGAGVPFADSLIGAAVGYASLALIAWGYRALRHREGMGGGDPKLFAAIGAWLGWQMLPPVLLLASVVGLASAGLRGSRPAGTDQLPLGTFLALAAWPIWLITTAR